MSVGDRIVEARFDAKAAEQAPQKQRIAARAAMLVEPGEAIYLDSGSTCLELARLLAGRSDLVIITNSLPAIVELAGKDDGPRLIVIGGELRPLSRSIVGPLTLPLLEQVYVDRAFMGTFGLSFDDGLSTTDPAEAFTKQHALARAREVVLLVDASKFRTRSFAHAGGLADVDVVITDTSPDEEAEAAFEQAGIRVLVA